MKLTSVLVALVGCGSVWAQTAEERCRGVDKEMAVLERDVTEPLGFCKFFLSEKRGFSPLPDVKDTWTLIQACVCTIAEAGIPKVTPSDRAMPTKPVFFKCNDSILPAIDAAFRHPKAFCNFYLTKPQSLSPIRGVTAQDLYEGCACIAELPTRFVKPSHTSQTSIPAAIRDKDEL
ncbi:U3 small nucleolar RNA-associated protein 20 [Sphaceloma murrayae]|uniref:U3 small nucleolar RNA-associated protein 20 n=1 Tax=Sphaceloma murrayae TaxID=2082308 RepID=A0A2K1QLZ2_9PEZI|nr:U3 small nucleolar RNA-associated protein 20 [Sphaceloma murrayae]